MTVLHPASTTPGVFFVLFDARVCGQMESFDATSQQDWNSLEGFFHDRYGPVQHHV
jgi:hypothetical protein